MNIEDLDLSLPSKNTLNIKARLFLLDHCVSKRAADILVSNFTGYVNGDYVEGATLMRIDGVWYVGSHGPIIKTLGGNAYAFHLVRTTID